MTALEGRILDCRGMRCPAPIIHLGRALPDVAIGEYLGVAATDVAARVDVPAFARMRGQTYAGETVADDGVPVYWVRRDA
ncbi:sulfurtransferase TusA family protein [Nocardioides daejeonensis]|uniref:sulfurtransferase TusA family protein n=1 Tax=Nocardioides daejeonensis TaxID=1046556 RepID=UPI001EF4F7B5|nr:sulfurtransferase TusA family protein [Nocardioides daejeonensis]